MLIQTDPFRDIDTLFSRFAGSQTNTAGTAGVMPMDAFRRGTDVWVHIDLPGVKALQPRHHRRTQPVDHLRRTQLAAPGR